jgi:predicted nucleic acid-binding protein
VLVVDASVVVTACLGEAGLETIAREDLVAPHLMWSEASSVLHELRWRKEISDELVDRNGHLRYNALEQHVRLNVPHCADL